MFIMFTIVLGNPVTPDRQRDPIDFVLDYSELKSLLDMKKSFSISQVSYRVDSIKCTATREQRDVSTISAKRHTNWFYW